MSTVMNDSLPAMRVLLHFAVILPAIVVGGNLAFLKWASSEWKSWYFPIASISVAILGWCSGTYLRKAWIGWLVFAWSLALLDFLTLLATADFEVRDEFAYVLISAEISLLILWAVLGPGQWQWRVPIAMALVPIVAIYVSEISIRDLSQHWNRMMLFTTAVVTVLCLGLRLFGFVLDNPHTLHPDAQSVDRKPRLQFGMKHMLIWLTVTGPLVLVSREIDFDGESIFPALLVAISAATINLIAIWAVLGSGFWPLRILACLLVPYAIGVGLETYSLNLFATTVAKPGQSSPIAYIMGFMRRHWRLWMFYDAALLAALLLFLRASGYRLMLNDRRNKSENT
jgi:hypothetical protein